MTRKNIRGAATVTVVAALAAAVATSGGHSGTADAATQNAAVVLPSTSSATPTSGTAGGPAGGPGMGATVTGAAAEKAKAAALAKYPGTVERVVKTPSGGYVVHVIKADHTEVHVLVNAAFQVTGTATGGPGHFGGRPPWLTAPNARRGSASGSASSPYPTARA
jgi:hypothetical protein